MNSPISAKAAISSNRSSISLWSIPKIRPFSITFSRPVNSGLKPEPSPKMAVSRPFTSTVPVVGCKTPEIILSRVLLPAPLRPMIPRVVPGLTWRSMSCSAQKSWLRLTLPKLRLLLAARTGSRRSCTSCLFPRGIRRASQLIREPRPEPDEDGESQDENRRGEEGEVERRLRAGQLAVEDQSPVGLHKVGERIVVHYPREVFRQLPRWPEYRGGEEHPPDDGAHHLCNVGHVRSDHGHKVGQAENEQQLEDHDEREQQDGPVPPVFQHQEDDQERPQAEEFVYQGRDRVGEGEQLEREDHLLHQPGVALDAVYAFVEGFGEGQERQEAAVQEEAEVQCGIPLDDPEAYPDHLREDQREEEDPDQGSQERPREAEVRSLVAAGHLALYEVLEQPPLVVERAKGVEERARQAFLRASCVRGQYRPSSRP